MTSSERELCTILEKGVASRDLALTAECSKLLGELVFDNGYFSDDFISAMHNMVCGIEFCKLENSHVPLYNIFAFNINLLTDQQRRLWVDMVRKVVGSLSDNTTALLLAELVTNILDGNESVALFNAWAEDTSTQKQAASVHGINWMLPTLKEDHLKKTAMDILKKLKLGK